MKKTSSTTAPKQHCLEKIAGRILSQWSHLKWSRPIVIDAMAGDGLPSEGKNSSPQILSKLADTCGFPFLAIEKDEAQIETLKLAVQGRVFHGDIIDGLEYARKRSHKHFGGLIYIDPNGTITEKVGTACSSFNRVDVLLNLACAGFKRSMRHSPRICDILEATKKNFWFYRPPIGKYQWTMLLGSETDLIRTIPSIGFQNINTEEGLRVLSTIQFTHNELQDIQGIPQSSDIQRSRREGEESLKRFLRIMSEQKDNRASSPRVLQMGLFRLTGEFKDALSGMSRECAPLSGVR